MALQELTPVAEPIEGKAPRRFLVAIVGALLLLVIVRVITDSDEITSSGTFGAALRLAVPILLAGLGALYAERSGVVNIGLEGMMILGTWCGAFAGVKYGPWAGALFGTVGGALGGLVHAIATVSFGIDHVVSGVGINILALGVARFLSVIYFTPLGGGATQSPQVTGTVGKFSVPFLAGGGLLGWKTPDFFGWLEARHWFLISDIGGLLKGLTGNLSWLTVIALVLVPVTLWVLWRTRAGLRIRSAGEHPLAAESLGIPVYRMKYLGVVVSGALAGLGGAFLVLEAAGIYREGQTGGRGYIGLAALIFGNWRPGGVLAAAGLFGYADALQLRRSEALHGILLFVALGLSVVGLWYWWRWIKGRGSLWPRLIVTALSGLFFWWYFVTDTVPRQFIFFTPHLTTLLVLSLASQRLRPPAADGRPYRKGQAQ
jgi:ABC-type uncharacterized transport system permease subunit